MATIYTKEENQAWAKTLPGKMCSACMILRHNNKALMVQASYKDHWTFPGGIVDEGESPLQAAIRETREETGIDINPENVALFQAIFTLGTDGDRDRFNFAFLADIDDATVQLSIPNDEISEATWAELSEVATLAKNKGSYVEFQKSLLNPVSHSKYTEI